MKPVQDQATSDGIKHQLKTRVLAKGAKMDIFIQTFTGGRKVCTHDARICEFTLPHYFPKQSVASIADLHEVLSNPSNYNFVLGERELEIAVGGETVRVDMTPNTK